MKVSLTKIVVFLIDILVLALIGHIQINTYSDIGLLSVVVYSYIIITQIIIYKHANLSVWFFVINYFYCFGQFFLALVGYEGNLSIRNSSISFDGMCRATIFILACSVLLRIGTLLVRTKNKKTYTDDEHCAIDTELYNTAKLLLVIVFVPAVISLGEDLYQTVVFGYGARITDRNLMNFGFSATFDILADFLLPIIVALYLTDIGHKSKWVYALCIVYGLVYAFTGSRIDIAMLALVLLYPLFIKYKIKLKPKTIILLSIGGYLLVFIFTLISEGRAQGNLSLKNMGDLIEITKEAEPITHMLREAGWTFMVIAQTMVMAGNSVPYNYGASYLSGVNMILPNVAGLCSYANSVAGVDNLVKRALTEYGGVGSSFIAEAYLNFGMLALPFMMLLGAGLGRIAITFDDAVKQRNTLKQFLALYAFSIVSFYVRSDTRTFLRFFCWYGLSIAAITIYKIQKKKKLYYSKYVN